MPKSQAEIEKSPLSEEQLKAKADAAKIKAEKLGQATGKAPKKAKPKAKPKKKLSSKKENKKALKELGPFGPAIAKVSKWMDENGLQFPTG